VVGARAFTEYVARDALPGEQLVLHGELFGQRFSTAPVPASAEPAFEGEAFVELPAALEAAPGPAPGVSGQEGPGLGHALKLLSLKQPLHLLVVQLLPPASPRGPDQPSALAAAASASSGLPPPQQGSRGQLDAARESTLQRQLVVALGEAEWRTVLVRKRQVTISVVLSSGPASESP
jgi:centrosomal protein CEP76